MKLFKQATDQRRSAAIGPELVLSCPLLLTVALGHVK